MPPELQEGCSGAALAIWTTTPWTMPANAAVAVNEKLLYSIVQAEVSLNTFETAYYMERPVQVCVYLYTCVHASTSLRPFTDLQWLFDANIDQVQGGLRCV